MLTPISCDNYILHSIVLIASHCAAGRKRCPLSGRNLDRDWVVIEPDDELRARIRAWAKEKRLDLDALEVAAYKLRGPKNRMLGSLSDQNMLESAFPSAHTMPRQALLIVKNERAASSAPCTAQNFAK